MGVDYFVKEKSKVDRCLQIVHLVLAEVKVAINGSIVARFMLNWMQFEP